MEQIKDVAQHFCIEGEILSAESYGCGHINTTFLVTTDKNKSYILQKINTGIFVNPGELMENINNVTIYLSNIIKDEGGDPQRGVLHIIPSCEGKLYITINDGTWRMFSFVNDSVTLQVIEHPVDFYYAGKAFGKFTRQLDSYPADTLHETIKNFHNTPSRYNDFEAAVKENASGKAESVAEEIEFVRERKDFCSLFTDKIENNTLPLRVTHNDTKLNNVLFDRKTGKPIAVVDLDTVMPGLSLYDFGDAIRFGTNPAAEDEKDLDKVYCSLELFEAFTRGYLEECGQLLTDEEINMLPYAGKMMTLECGMRFLADHIAGDVYFRIHRENHNLDRCRTQFKLVKDMEEKEEQIKEIINRICSEIKDCRAVKA